MANNKIIMPFSYLVWAIIIVISHHHVSAALPLRFTQEPLAEMITVNGGSAMLHCQVNDPQATIQWYRNEQLWTTPDSILSNHSIWIKSVNQSYLGKYQCYASNDNYTIVSRYSYIKWATIGEFTINMTADIIAYIGHPLAIPCYPPPSNPSAIISFRNKGNLVYEPGRIQVLSSGSLFIANVTRQDRGKYKCFAKNPLLPDQEKNSGPLRSVVTVENKNKLSNTIGFATSPREITAAAYTNVTLECVPLADPKPIIRWERISGVLPPGRHYIQNGNLVIERVRLSDSANYRCHLTNTAGSTSAEARLTVLAPPEVHLPAITTTYIGADIDLNCSATGSAIMAIQWFQNGVKLTQTDFRSRIRTNYNHLYIRQINKQDETIYQCIASNKYGSSQVTTYLKVSSGRPSIPIMTTSTTSTNSMSSTFNPLNTSQSPFWPWIKIVPKITFIRQDSKTNATIIWSFHSDARADVKSFTITYNMTNSFSRSLNYNTISNISPKSTQYTVQYLRVGQRYKFSIRANYKNGRQSDDSNSMEIQLIENIKPPVVVPFIQHAYWIQSKAIEIRWTLRPETVTTDVITHYRLCYMIIDNKGHTTEGLNYRQFDNVGLYQYRLYGLQQNQTYLAALQAINGEGSGKLSLFYYIKLSAVAPSTPTSNDITPTSDLSAVSESIISSSTPTDDDLVIFTVAVTLCAIVSFAAVILIIHIVKKRRKLPQARKGASMFQPEPDRSEEIQIVPTNTIVPQQNEGVTETSVVNRNNIVESNYCSSSNVDKSIEPDSVVEQSPAAVPESEQQQEPKFIINPKMNSESEGKAAHVAEWMTNHPQQAFDHSDSFNNIPRDYSFTRTDRRRASKRRSRRRRHRNYGQTENRYSRRTEPNSHSEYYSYQSNQSKKYRRRTDGSSSSCNDKLPRGHSRRTNYCYDDQSEYEERPHITNNRMADNRGFPSPTDTMCYEDRYVRPIYIQDRQPIHDGIPTNRITPMYDDRQCESNNDHTRMHLHPNTILHPAINNNPLHHHPYCDGCSSSHAGGTGSSNHASHGYFRPHYQHCIADSAYPVFEGDSHHTQYPRNYPNSPHFIRLTIPSPKDSYLHQQQCTIEASESYYAHVANQDGSPIEPTTTPAGVGQLPLNYSHESPSAIADHSITNTPIDNPNNNNHSNNNNNNNNRQFNIIPTPESNTDPHMADYDRNYGSDYDIKYQSNDEKPTDSIDLDNMSHRSRLSPPEADDYKRVESRT